MVVKTDASMISRQEWEQFVVVSRCGKPSEYSEEDKRLLRQVHELYPDRARNMSTLATVAVMQMIKAISDAPDSVKSIWRDIAGIQYDLGYHTTGPMDRQFIEQVVVCWLQLCLTQIQYNQATRRQLDARQGLYWEKRLTMVQNRYTRALETLARIRNLMRRTPVQINIGGQQVNVASATIPPRYGL